MIDDFGPDFDEEGQPLEEGESDRVKDEEEHSQAGPHRRGGREAEDDAEAEAEKAEKTVEDAERETEDDEEKKTEEVTA